MPRRLLIDADILAYECSASNETAMEVEDGYWTWHVNVKEVQGAIQDRISDLMDSLHGDEYVLCLSDHPDNFRKDILPSYKGNRTGIKKPLALKAVREWMHEDLGAILRPGLEGDDCLGILATMRKRGAPERVIVSPDKDMQTIPGLWSRDGKSVAEITERDADLFHMFQTLTGDTTDGYYGCPGVGPVNASSILLDAYPDLWDAVVDTYEDNGLTLNDALVQAQVSRILRATDYDFKRKEPIPWIPSIEP